jgi:SAM-dependent methyltransferase
MIQAQQRVLQATNSLKSLAIRLRNRLEGNLPIPPANLIVLAAGVEDVAWFLEAGKRGADSIRDLLDKNGLSMQEVSPILDFGCGCGRVLRHWAALERVELHGTDYNPRLARWCDVELPFARVKTNELQGKLDYGDGQFGLVYALSVFTHLSELMQSFWIEELSRIVRPGGYLLITVHGEPYFETLLSEEQTRFRRGELVVRSEEQAGSNVCAVFHPESYVRETLARDLDVVDFWPEGARGNPRQDAYLLRKPATRSET